MENWNWKEFHSCKLVNFLIQKSWTPSLSGGRQLGIFLLYLETTFLVITRHSCFFFFSFFFFFFFFFYFYFYSKCNSKTLDSASAWGISLLSWVFPFKSANSFFQINSEESILLKLLNSFIVTLYFCYFCQNSLFKLS